MRDDRADEARAATNARADQDGDLEVKQFVEGLARAVTMGNGRTAVRFWELPALVASDDLVRLVTSNAEVEQHFSTAKNDYAVRGIMDTLPELVSLQWLTRRIVMVTVRWPYLNARGDEVGEESMTYTLRRDDHGNLRLRAAILHGERKRRH
jgi:hypothetical protein